MNRFSAMALLLSLGLVMVDQTRAESGQPAWMRYAALEEISARRYRAELPAAIVAFGDSPLIDSARSELIRGVQGMLGRTLRAEAAIPRETAIVIGTLDALKKDAPALAAGGAIPLDGFRIRSVTATGVRHIVITGSNPHGVLYGTFAFLRKLGLQENILALNEDQAPYAPIRWVNEWANLDGSIERGYGGRSVFFEANAVRKDLTRAGEYGRLLASLGISACVINSVNTNPRLYDPAFLAEVPRVAAELRRWGVRVALAVDLGMPRSVGKLDTFDPLSPQVIDYWRNQVDAIYKLVPDMAGFVLKADSEGRVGPSAYGRTHADAANVVARALKPHGGLFFYRGFVYNHRMDWRELKNDRARAAVDNFKSLDGQFDDNVVIQIKHGPIDFQVREPASPLFGTLEKTNQAIELQITQEYFGQSRHTVFLVPMWKEALDFDMHARGAGTPVKALATGRVFNRPTGGFVGVSNVGMDENWFNNHMSQANLYGFGRLAWNPDLTSKQIIDEWTRLTFGHNPKVVDTINNLNLASWRDFENYTGVLGLQTLTDITGTHYGPAVEASERNGWGQWHRSDEKGAGMDRTAATGTGFIGQFRPEVARVYESLATCPDELLLFMHHVPYTHKLRSGKTVIQHIYDTHYEGARAVGEYPRRWEALKGLVDERRYNEVLTQLEYQAGHVQVWRDAIVSWYFKTSGIPDAAGRAGKFPGRTEVEAMKLEGYAPKAVLPWETASGGQSVECAGEKCAAAFTYNGPAGWFTLRVQYFDRPGAVARFRLLRGAQVLDEWLSDDNLPARKNDGASSKHRLVRGIALRPGDEIKIEGVPGGFERAALDYVEVLPDRN